MYDFSQTWIPIDISHASNSQGLFVVISVFKKNGDFEIEIPTSHETKTLSELVFSPVSLDESIPFLTDFGRINFFQFWVSLLLYCSPVPASQSGGKGDSATTRTRSRLRFYPMVFTFSSCTLLGSCRYALHRNRTHGNITFPVVSRTLSTYSVSSFSRSTNLSRKTDFV